MFARRGLVTALAAIDVIAGILALVGFHIAFRQQVVRRLLGRSSQNLPEVTKDEPDELASVFRIFGIMLMAFAITVGVFANLIAHYSGAVAAS
jgi:hypothetical protein